MVLVENIALVITDMFGKIVYRADLMKSNGAINEKIPIPSGLSNGMYMVNLNRDNEAHVFPVIIKQ